MIQGFRSCYSESGSWEERCLCVCVCFSPECLIGSVVEVVCVPVCLCLCVCVCMCVCVCVCVCVCAFWHTCHCRVLMRRRRRPAGWPRPHCPSRCQYGGKGQLGFLGGSKALVRHTLAAE